MQFLKNRLYLNTTWDQTWFNSKIRTIKFTTLESENYNIWKMTKGVTSNSKIGNDTSIEHALESRLIGSNVFQSSDSLLDQLLSIHHRAHYHVHVSEKTKK